MPLKLSGPDNATSTALGKSKRDSAANQKNKTVHTVPVKKPKKAYPPDTEPVPPPPDDDTDAVPYPVNPINGPQKPGGTWVQRPGGTWVQSSGDHKKSKQKKHGQKVKKKIKK